MILSLNPTLSDEYKILHTVYGLEMNRKRKFDKTYRYARDHKLSRLQMWNLAINILKSKNLEYLPVTKDRDIFNNDFVLFAYVYRKRAMYVKYYVNNKIINLRSLHPTTTKDSRFKSLRE